MGSSDKISKHHIFQDPDSSTCGPSCLTMVYSMKGKKISLNEILRDFHHPEKGKNTYTSHLARHLNKNGLQTKLTISTSKLLSPAWEDLPREELIENLKAWITLHPESLWLMEVIHILFYLQEGGQVQQESYYVQTIKDMIDKKSLVILCIDVHWAWGHRTKLEGTKIVVDELEGVELGHFVIVTGYKDNKFHVLDPFPTNLENRHGEYDIEMNQLVNASLTWHPTVLEVLD